MGSYKKMLLMSILLLTSSVGSATECEGLNDDGALCVWLRNKTDEPITVVSYGPYSQSADLNDDYYIANFPLVIAPGQSKALANIDDQGWGIFNYDTVKFRAQLILKKNGNNVTTYGAYVKADLGAGIVNDFEYGTRDSAWVDNTVKAIEDYGDAGRYQVTFAEKSYLEGYFTYIDADQKPDLTDQECEYLDNDGALCIWLRNTTSEAITVTSFGPYSNNADLNDDYYIANFPMVIEPGQERALANIDDQGWGAFNYDIIKMRAQLLLNKGGDQISTYGAFVKVNIDAGIVGDFEYSLDGNQWVDYSISDVKDLNSSLYQVSFSEESYLEGYFSFMDIHKKSGVYALSDWVSQVYKERGDTTLRQMVIPGTHDAGTYNINENSDLAPDLSTELKIAYEAAKKSAVGWSKTQSFNAKEMLEQGIRHLDLRIKKHQGKFVIVHGFVGMRVDELLKQVREFANEHPQEPIILEVAKTPSTADMPALLDIFDQYVGDRKPDSNIKITQLTLDKIWEKDLNDDKNNNVIVIWRSSSLEGKSRGYYGSEALTGSWANTEKKNELHDYLFNALKEAPTDKLYYSAFTFTPKDMTVVLDALNPFFDHDLLSWTTNKMRSYIGDWVPKWHELGYRINIMTADFYEYTTLVATAIELNTVASSTPDKKLMYKLGHSYNVWQGRRAHEDVDIWRITPESGFYSLGDIANSDNNFALNVKPLLIKGEQPGVTSPLGYNWVWNNKGAHDSQNNKVSIWRPIAPAGFVCLGDIVTLNHGIAPSVDLMRCVHQSYVEIATRVAKTWDDRGSGADLDVSLWYSDNTTEETLNIGSMRANLGYSQPEFDILYVLDNTKLCNESDCTTD